MWTNAVNILTVGFQWNPVASTSPQRMVIRLAGPCTPGLRLRSPFVGLLVWVAACGPTPSPAPLNPLGVKGVGETGTVPAAAAIVSAVENALEPFGARISDYPVKPSKIIEVVRAGS